MSNKETFWLCFVLFSLFALFGYAYFKEEIKEDKFMASCTQDHKEYECEAMYK